MFLANPINESAVVVALLVSFKLGADIRIERNVIKITQKVEPFFKNISIAFILDICDIYAQNSPTFLNQ